MRLHCAHVIPLGADAFWSVIHAPEYEALVAEALGLREYRELERRDEKAEIYRRIQVVPELPEALRTLLRRAAGLESASYVEEQWRSRERREVRFRLTPSFLPARSRIEGRVRVEPRDDASCTRILEGVVEIGVPLVGRLFERAVVANAVEGYGKSAAVVDRLPAASGLSASRPPAPAASRTPARPRRRARGGPGRGPSRP
jgi:hypothetical protein